MVGLQSKIFPQISLYGILRSYEIPSRKLWGWFSRTLPFFPLDLVMIIFSTLPKTFGRLELFPFSTLPVFLYWAHHLSIVLNGTSRSLATSCYLISASIIPTARPLTSKLCCFIFSDIDILDDEIKQVLVYCTAKKLVFKTFCVHTVQMPSDKLCSTTVFLEFQTIAILSSKIKPPFFLIHPIHWQQA